MSEFIGLLVIVGIIILIVVINLLWIMFVVWLYKKGLNLEINVFTTALAIMFTKMTFDDLKED